MTGAHQVPSFGDVDVLGAALVAAVDAAAGPFPRLGQHGRRLERSDPGLELVVAGCGAIGDVHSALPFSLLAPPAGWGVGVGSAGGRGLGATRYPEPAVPADPASRGFGGSIRRNSYSSTAALMPSPADRLGRKARREPTATPASRHHDPGHRGE